MNNPELAIFNSLVEAARQYCSLIDRIPARNDWLKPLSKILPRLHERIVALGDPGEGSMPPGQYDLDDRFDLFSRLRSRLGERDTYWMEFDDPAGTSGAEESRTGSLADDLTDIYFELKRGLNMLDAAGPEAVAELWELGFRKHWGQHVIDAERHLYALNLSGRLH